MKTVNINIKIESDSPNNFIAFISNDYNEHQVKAYRHTINKESVASIIQTYLNDDYLSLLEELNLQESGQD